MRHLNDDQLGRVSATYQSSRGTIGSNWEIAGDDAIWKITIPPGSQGKIGLPKSWQHQSGQRQWTSGPGQHTFFLNRF
jgi:hypothetical protein